MLANSIAMASVILKLNRFMFLIFLCGLFGKIINTCD